MNTGAKSVTFAIITDLHGNELAIKEALKLVKARPDVDRLICLGDCFSLGSDPKGVYDHLMELDDVVFVRGNHDRYLVERIWEYDRPTVEGMDPDDPVCIGVIANQKWTADQLGEEGIQFIRKMRLSYFVSVNGTYIEFTHAWFGRDEMPPNLDEAKTWRDHEAHKHPEVNRFVLVHGHTHLPRNEHFGNLRIFCPGSTGLPFDEDPRGVVAFLTVDENDVHWEVQRFDYDTEAAIAQMKDRQPPFYQNLVATLKYASIRNDMVD